MLHSSAHPRLDHIAHEEQLGNANGNLKHYVGVYDPTTGEFTMTEVHKVTLRSTLRPTQEELDKEEAEAKAKLTFTSARNTLGQAFGTKKAKKAIADQTDNAITSRKPGETAPVNDAVTEAMMESLKGTTSGMLTVEQRQEAVDSNKPRPEPNMEATSPAEVYALGQLIPDETLTAMAVRDWEQAMEKDEDVQVGMRFVAKRLKKVATGKDATKMLKVLKYVYILLTWYINLEPAKQGKKVPDAAKLKEKVDASANIIKGIQQRFADGRYVS